MDDQLDASPNLQASNLAMRMALAKKERMADLGGRFPGRI